MVRKGSLRVQTKQAICADRVAGMKVNEIAERHQVHRVTVSKVLARFRREAPNSVLAGPEGNYRERLKGKSIRVLDCGEDQYKRGGIAVQVMKGIGEVTDSLLVGVQVSLNEPPGWRTTYRGQAERVDEQKAIDSKASED
jgi:hypothetical protein